MINFQRTQAVGNKPAKILAEHFQHSRYSKKSVTQRQNQNMPYGREIPYDLGINYEVGLEMRSDRIPFKDLSNALRPPLENFVRDSPGIFSNLGFLASRGFEDLVKDGFPGRTGILGCKFRLKLGVVRKN